MPRSAGSPPPLLLLLLLLVVTLLSPSCGLVTGHRFRSAQLSSHQRLDGVKLPSRALCGALCLRRPQCSAVEFSTAERQCWLYKSVMSGDGVSPAPEGLALDQELTTTTAAPFQCIMPNWEIGYDGHCYFFSSYKTFPDDADQECRNLHPEAHITSVTNADEKVYIISKINDKIVVGLIRSSASTDDWHWENGDPSTDFRGFFKDGEPKNNDAQRLFTHMLSGTGELMSAADGDNTFFVCKIGTF